MALQVVLQVLVGGLEQEVGETLYWAVYRTDEDRVLVCHDRRAEVDEVVLAEPTRQTLVYGGVETAEGAHLGEEVAIVLSEWDRGRACVEELWTKGSHVCRRVGVGAYDLEL